MKILTADEKARLAGVMYDYIAGIEHTRNQLLVGYATTFQTTESYAKEQIKGRRNLREIQADWIIDQIWGMVSVKKLREFFYSLFNESPEQFGYDVPVYNTSSNDEVSSEMSLFQKWKEGKLGQKVESV